MRPLLLVSMLSLAACAHDGYGHGYGYAYYGRNWAPGTHPRSPRPHESALTGPGVEILDEWLRDTREGRAVVSLGFRDARHGEVSEDVAHRANIWFRRYADANRDMTITDPEIRRALVTATGRYLR